MTSSVRDIDPTFQGVGQKAGMEMWRIENFKPVSIEKSSHGKFFTGDSYIILWTKALKSGALRHDIHYWLGKDTSKDEASTAAIKTVELDAALGGRTVQYREVQGRETEKFLSYFKPCILPQEGGVSSEFKHPEQGGHKIRLLVCRGKHTIQVQEVPFARSSLNHDEIFILDTELKIFQFNGSNSCIQERAKALDVVQHIKDTYHDGKCDIATIEDGRLMADVETGEFWGFFGGFAPLPRKTAMQEVEKSPHSYSHKLLSLKKGQVETMEVKSLTRELLDTSKCYLLDCGIEVFVWMGKATSLDERKNASKVAEEYVRSHDRPPKCHIVRTMEGFETVAFRLKFDSWSQTSSTAAAPVEGRGKVAAMLKLQGVDVKGLLKAEPMKEEPQPNIDCTGDLQVWRVNGQEKIFLSASEQSKFYSGDCYIFQYSYPGEDREEYLVGTWFGKKSVEEERDSAISLAARMIESLMFMATQVRIYEGNEPIQFFSILQNFIVFKGGLSDGYKNHITDNQLMDETYKEDGVALFRVQGYGPDNMQAIQVEPVATSLNSSYCFILHNDSSVFTWIGGLTRAEDQELLERQLDLIKPNAQPKMQKEGTETEAFWELLGGKADHPSQKIARTTASDLHLFCCAFPDGNLKVTEIYNFDQDNLTTEDIFILDCLSEIFVWVGKQVNPKKRLQALTIAENFLQCDFLIENLSGEAPVYVIMEGSEPRFFTCFFTWDSVKSAMPGNSFQRKLAILKHGGTANIDISKRKVLISHVGRWCVPEKSHLSRSASFNPERVRIRGRSPAFNALAAHFEKPNIRNLSSPPPMIRKLYPKLVTTDPTGLASKSAAIAALTASFEKTVPTPQEACVTQSVKASPKALKPGNEQSEDDNLKTNEIKSIQVKVKVGEAEDEEVLTLHPYERLTTTSTNPVTDIDVSKREAYLSAGEFKEKFGMTKDAFYKLPKWKQTKLKIALQLF
ncbi:hypothetical protein SAY87_023307 [Trapa incisa]|uniref:HP domain-containing protein n=1 Tax=Trapa incisa TaxID=236973 RepID=A0AAN7K918_9MYRT|nr:hypothetical protein SAY87_023307 [Trapa incisa]